MLYQASDNNSVIARGSYNICIYLFDECDTGEWRESFDVAALFCVRHPFCLVHRFDTAHEGLAGD